MSNMSDAVNPGTEPRLFFFDGRRLIRRALRCSSLLLTIALAAFLHAATAQAASAVPMLAPSAQPMLSPCSILTETAYYYRGRSYPYRYHGMYFRHRYYRYGRWHYY